MFFCSHPNSKKRENGVITVGKFYKSHGKVAGINWYSETEINKGFLLIPALQELMMNTLVFFTNLNRVHLFYSKNLKLKI